MFFNIFYKDTIFFRFLQKKMHRKKNYDAFSHANQTAIGYKRYK